MLDSNLNDEQKRQIGQQILLTLELQKHLNIYTQDIEKRKYLTRTLKASTGQLFNQIHELLIIIAKIKKSLQISRENSEVEKQEDMNEIPEFVIKDVNTVMIKSEKDVMSVANKLKVLVSKTMQIQKQSCQYNFPCYLSLAQELFSSNVFDPQQEKMMKELRQLRKAFKVVNLEDMMKYKHHPASYRSKDVLIYASFYIERLLFFQDNPLPFNGNLLFAPLCLSKYESIQTKQPVYILIHHWFFKQLSKHNINWENFCLQLIIRDTKKQKIKYYSLITFQKKRFDDETINLLKKIRCFVYFHLIFNYLENTLIFNSSSTSSKKSIKIQLNEKLTLEINNQKSMYTEKTNPLLMKYFLKYFDEKEIKNRGQKNKEEATNNLIRYMLCNICGLKHNVELPIEYINLKPKYIYVGDKRVKI